MDLVGGDGGQVEVFGRIDAAVEQDDRDFGFLGFGQHVVPAGGDDGGDQDGVDALGDEAADGLDLVFLLLLRIGELEVDAAASACCLVTEVSAARQPDSEPIWLKPTTRPLRFSWAMLTEVKAVARLAAMASLVMMVHDVLPMWPPRRVHLRR